MLNAITGLFQDGSQLPIALLPPCWEEPLVVEGLEFWRSLPEDMVEAGPAALDPEPGPPVQCDAADNLLGLELAQGRKFQTGEDQSPTGRHIQVLQ